MMLTYETKNAGAKPFLIPGSHRRRTPESSLVDLNSRRSGNHRAKESRMEIMCKHSNKEDLPQCPCRCDQALWHYPLE